MVELYHVGVDGYEHSTEVCGTSSTLKHESGPLTWDANKPPAELGLALVRSLSPSGSGRSSAFRHRYPRGPGLPLFALTDKQRPKNSVERPFCSLDGTWDMASINRIAYNYNMT
jgi:hypothetical protein